MNTSKGKLTARIVALAASIAVGLGVWVGVAKPPAQNVSEAVAAAVIPDPSFNINDNFLAVNPTPSITSPAQPPPAVQNAPAQTYQVQTRSPRVRTRAS